MVLRKNIVFHEPQKVADGEWTYPETGSMWVAIPSEWKTPDEFMQWCQNLNAKLDIKKRFRVSHAGLSRTHSVLSICGATSQQFMRSESLRVVEVPDEVIYDVKGNLLEPLGVRENGEVRMFPRQNHEPPSFNAVNAPATQTNDSTDKDTSNTTNDATTEAPAEEAANTTNTTAAATSTPNKSPVAASTAATTTAATTSAATTTAPTATLAPTTSSATEPVYLLSPTPPVQSPTPQPSSPEVPSPFVRPGDAAQAAPEAAGAAAGEAITRPSLISGASAAAPPAPASAAPAVAPPAPSPAVNMGVFSAFASNPSPTMTVNPQPSNVSMGAKMVMLCAPVVRGGKVSLQTINQVKTSIPSFPSMAHFKQWLFRLFPDQYQAQGMYGITVDPSVVIDSFDTVSQSLFPPKMMFINAPVWYIYHYTPPAQRQVAPQPMVSAQKFQRMVEITKNNAESYAKLEKRVGQLERELAQQRSIAAMASALEPRIEHADKHRQQLSNRMDSLHGMLNKFGSDFALTVNNFKNLQNRLSRVESLGGSVPQKRVGSPFEQPLQKKQKNSFSNDVLFSCETGIVPDHISALVKSLKQFPTVTNRGPDSNIEARFELIGGKLVLLAGSKDKWEFGFGDTDVGGSNPYYESPQPEQRSLSQPQLSQPTQTHVQQGQVKTQPTQVAPDQALHVNTHRSPQIPPPSAHIGQQPAHVMSRETNRVPSRVSSPLVPLTNTTLTRTSSGGFSPIAPTLTSAAGTAAATAAVSASVSPAQAQTAFPSVPEVAVPVVAPVAVAAPPATAPDAVASNQELTQIAAEPPLAPVTVEPPVEPEVPLPERRASESRVPSNVESRAPESREDRRASDVPPRTEVPAPVARERASDRSDSRLSESREARDSRTSDAMVDARKQRQHLLDAEKRMSDSITASLTSAENSPVVGNISRDLERDLERAEEERREREEREARENELREAQGRRKAAQKAQARAKAQLAAEEAAREAARERARAVAEKKRAEVAAAEEAEAAAEAERVRVQEARVAADKERLRVQEALNDRSRIHEAAKTARESSKAFKKQKAKEKAHDAAIDIINKLTSDAGEQEEEEPRRGGRQTTPVAPNPFSRSASNSREASVEVEEEADQEDAPAAEAPTAKERAEKMRQLREKHKSVEPVKVEKVKGKDKEKEKEKTPASDKSDKPRDSVPKKRLDASAKPKRVEKGVVKKVKKPVAKPAAAPKSSGGMFERLKKAIPGYLPPPPKDAPKEKDTSKDKGKDKDKKKKDKDKGVSSDSSLSDAIWIDISD